MVRKERDRESGERNRLLEEQGARGRKGGMRERKYSDKAKIERESKER